MRFGQNRGAHKLLAIDSEPTILRSPLGVVATTI